MPSSASSGPAATGVVDLTGVPPSDIHETHGSRVYLLGDRAYKVRKPVRFPFLDQSTPAAREALAEAEVRLNQELATETYLGVRPVRVTGGEELATEMRRFDEADTLASRLDAGRLDADMLTTLGERIAQFHLTTPSVDAAEIGSILARLNRNTEELAALVGPSLSTAALWRTARALQVAALRHADVLAARTTAGWWREGHGDLRADHVVFDDRGLRIVDRLEFDRGLRVDDVGCDLAFLLMDLEVRGYPRAAETVLEAYRVAGGDPGDDVLVALWSGYRATVGIKVALTRAGQAGGEAALARVPELLAFVERCVWRTRVPRIFVVCGPPASGKSTVSHALQRRSGLPVVSSDIMRKESLALERTDRAPVEAYAPEASAQVYAALGAAAAAASETQGGAIVDATMGSAALRGVFVEALGDAGPVFYVECRAPQAETERRARARERDPDRISDATPEIAARLREAWEPLDEIPPHAHLIVRSDQPPSGILDELEARLDALESVADQIEAGFDELEAHVVQAHLLDRSGR